MSKTKENVTALQGYLDSLQCGIDKAKRGSDCEDGYILEKLEKFAAHMGYELEKKERYCESCSRLRTDIQWREDTEQYECQECYQDYLDEI